ncbi:MAG TPA: polysaccharide lyase family protein [Verrucomicrobiae bacterium]|nr:polysaccharide lyase family protein [Verrucomicrobiae bacterium]
MNLLRFGLATALGCLGFISSAFANLPGGGTNGPNVTLTDNGSTVTLANGIVSILCTKSGATINQINYTYNNGSGTQTTQLLAGGHNGGQLYWETGGFGTGTFTYSVVADPANNGGNYAEISLLSSSTTNGAMEIHFSMLRGSTGFYVTPIWSHRGTDAAMTMGETRDNIYAGSIFNWMSVDATRNRLMEVQPTAGAIGVLGAPVEVSLWTNGIYAGRYEDKYKYSADFGAQRVWGWSSVGAGGYNVGLWNVSASVEYYNGGPMKRELMEHIGTTILNMTKGSHYGGGTDSSWAAGEVWTHVYGPYFIYCNNVANTITDTNQAAQALYQDALAQAGAEASAWPYSWFTNANYTPASDRGTVTGQMVISDSYNPNASPAGLWIGLVQQPSTSTATYDFQEWMKPYQFWVKTDTNGNFTIPNVIAGANYTLYAFGPGAAGTFQSQAQSGGSAPNTVDIPVSPFSVTVTGGTTNNLGTVTWTPTRVGPTVFEIGYPDRTAAKFRHGEDWWVGDIGPDPAHPSPIWTKFLEYPFDFPGGPDYIVGQSRWTTDWNFIQPVVTDSAGNYNPSTSTITFNLASAPAAGSQASLYLALASDFQGPLIIQVNGNNIAGSTGYFPAYSGSGNESDASVREGIHGMFSDNRMTFAGSLLRQGQNSITINMRKGGYFANHAMYDYVRLELTGYVPPPPASATAYAGNNCNLICWPVTPGATSYNILRSTTSGSGYVSITNGVTGPVCGSGWNNATFLDTGAVNGTTYYYVVQSVNPGGASADSPQSTGVAPDAGISTSAPAAPAGLTAGSVGHQSVTLNWSASPGADFYTVYRSTLFDNGGGASNVLGTIVLANNVTGTTYTDASPTDGSIYSYSVTATSAGGPGSNSNSAVTLPLPTPPAGTPGSLTAAPFSVTNITLAWSPVAGAVGYVVQRSTSLNGTYVLLNSVTETNYNDYGLNTNVTYYYRVTPVNAGGIGTGGLTTTKPAAPASLTAFAGNTEIFLAWPASVGATGYVIQRGTSSGNETTTVASGIAGTNDTDTGLVNGTTYYYVVSATGTAANSGNSPEANATAGALTPPTIAKITVSGANFILSGTGGFPTSTYHVLASTNLALPVAQWTLMATNQYDTSGDFVITNVIDPAWPQTFYRLQSQ